MRYMEQDQSGHRNCYAQSPQQTRNEIPADPDSPPVMINLHPAAASKPAISIDELAYQLQWRTLLRRQTRPQLSILAPPTIKAMQYHIDDMARFLKHLSRRAALEEMVEPPNLPERRRNGMAVTIKE